VLRVASSVAPCARAVAAMSASGMATGRPSPLGEEGGVEARRGAVERKHPAAQGRAEVQVQVAPEHPLAATVRQSFDPGA
jgi:hypothetical protein